MSGITTEWTTHTHNPFVGCSIVVSLECVDCYAMHTAARLSRNLKTPHYAPPSSA
jgi:protein gp37